MRHRPDANPHAAGEGIADILVSKKQEFKDYRSSAQGYNVPYFPEDFIGCFNHISTFSTSDDLTPGALLTYRGCPSKG